jgi:hypothetical protein
LNTKLSQLPHISLAKYIYSTIFSNIENINILDYFDFNREELVELLKSHLDWRDYGGKHYESVYTRFFQGYILPKKFGIDKRKAHLSVLICTQQISRMDALKKLSEPPLENDLVKKDMELLLDKFNINKSEFENIMALPIKSWKDYKNNSWLFLLHENKRLFKIFILLKKLSIIPKGVGEKLVMSYKKEDS